MKIQTVDKDWINQLPSEYFSWKLFVHPKLLVLIH